MKLAPQEFKITGTRARNVRVIVKGHLRGSSEDITMVLHNTIPPNEPNNDQAALLVWQSISQNGGLTDKQDENTYHFWPLTLFSSLTADFQIVEEGKIIL